jgi:hypothetical protein
MIGQVFAINAVAAAGLLAVHWATGFVPAGRRQQPSATTALPG